MIHDNGFTINSGCKRIKASEKQILKKEYIMNAKNKITRKTAEKSGKYIGYFHMRKNGFGPEMWKIDVYKYKDQLYGGDKNEDKKYLDLMLESQKENIINRCKNKC